MVGKDASIIYMQRHSKETLQITKQLGEIVRKIRTKKGLSGRNFSHAYDIDVSNLSRVERGLIDCKITSFYRIAQALGLKPSKLMKMLEDELGEDFTLIDE